MGFIPVSTAPSILFQLVLRYKSEQFSCYPKTCGRILLNHELMFSRYKYCIDICSRKLVVLPIVFAEFTFATQVEG